MYNNFKWLSCSKKFDETFPQVVKPKMKFTDDQLERKRKLVQEKRAASALKRKKDLKRLKVCNDNRKKNHDALPSIKTNFNK